MLKRSRKKNLICSDIDGLLMEDEMRTLNAHRNKQAAIRELKQGKRSFLTPAFVDRYQWTKEEREFIEPFIRKIRRTEREDPSALSMDEVIETIDTHTNRAATGATYKSKANALMRLFDIKTGVFSDIFTEGNDADRVEMLKDRYVCPVGYIGFILWLRDHNEKLLSILTDERVRFYKEQFDLEKDRNSVRLIEARNTDTSYVNIYKALFDLEKHLRATQYGTMNHLIVTMYTTALYDEHGVVHMNPRNYFHTVRLVRDDEDINIADNFLNVVTGRMVINDFKTAGIYKPYDVTVSPDVLRVIESSLLKIPRDHLIVQNRGGVYTPSGMSEKVSRLLGYNIDTIRKAIESYEINVKHTCRLHMAFVSRHSVSTQDMSYVSRVN
jgi:hypothetical protein